MKSRWLIYIIPIYLLFISNMSVADPFVKVKVMPNGMTQWEDPDRGYGGRRFHYTMENDKFKGRATVNAPVVSARTGAMSAGTVTATIIDDKGKRQVMGEVVDKARIGGRALGKGAATVGRAVASRNPYGIAFLLALEAISGSDFKWNDEVGDFVKQDDGSDYYLFLSNEANILPSAMSESDLQRWCSGSVTIHAIYSSNLKGTQRTCEDIEIVKKSELSNDRYLRKCGGTKEEKYELNAHRACIKENKLMGKAVKVVRYVGYVPMTLDEFIEEGTSEAAQKPNDWVEASELKPTDEPKVEVPVGSVAQTDPYTDPKDKKVKQTRWDFDTGGRVRETEIERPDLTPGSPEAPDLKPPPKEGENDKEKDKDADKESASEPKAASAPFDLCKEHPEILACQRMGEVKEEDKFFDDIKIPSITDDKTWEEDRFLPSNGTCPAPKVFHVLGKPFHVSYEPLCSLMQQVRFIILIAFIVMSAYLVFGSLLRKD